ncbi:Mfs1.2 [Lentinula lateritia]|nr:Mfs1.2 [Lentinula lateritia]
MDDKEVLVLNPKKDAKFWLIFWSLCLTLFLSALEYAIPNALPVIINDLQGQEFAWIGTAYGLASTVFLPMSGNMAEIFGRRISVIIAILIFALGSALCGAAQSMGWLIAGRTVQGLGGGGIVALSSIVVSDMVPLEERGTYNGLIGLTWTMGVAFGPLIGGALAQHGHWRWLFYLNLPVCGVALICVILFMRLPIPVGSLEHKIKKIDWMQVNDSYMDAHIGTSMVIALTWGGVHYPWSSARVVVPLVLGLLGVISFFLFETLVASSPTIPLELLSNQTTVSGYLQVFINSLVVSAWIYYVPVFYQACKNASPIRSSIDMFGACMVIGPFVVLGGASVTVLKRYRPQLWIGWILCTVGVGAFSTSGVNTILATPIGLSAINAPGTGLIYGNLTAVTYFPVLSPLPVSENAHALALFAFLRSFAQIWGIAIGGAILTNQLKTNLPKAFLAQFPEGTDIIYSIIPQIKALPQPLQDEVRQAFAESLRPVWYTLTGIFGLGFLSSLFMKDVPMHNYVDEKWAIQPSSETEDAT